ncbi:hypothetical protein [Ranid herpesvirus 3]|uniref:Uncharacterized protein n=1 Tax=Ranid herpesvirus 3 TaxID=1987509 RepID=A0A1X9T5C4_9VIRU|nr:hypothetical protein [Ranid herpesvirus 3]ARR28897.1 hypothetical protein [Ranid herpesvirus 3]
MGDMRLELSGSVVYPLSFKNLLSADEKQSELCFLKTDVHEVKMKKSVDCTVCVSESRGPINLLQHATHKGLLHEQRFVKTCKILQGYACKLRQKTNFNNFYPKILETGFLFSNANHIPGKLLDELGYLPAHSLLWKDTALHVVFKSVAIASHDGRKRKCDDFEASETDPERKSSRLH